MIRHFSKEAVNELRAAHPDRFVFEVVVTREFTFPGGPRALRTVEAALVTVPREHADRLVTVGPDQTFAVSLLDGTSITRHPRTVENSAARSSQ